MATKLNAQKAEHDKALPHPEKKMEQTKIRPLDFILSAIFAAWNLPSINVPTGFSVSGLPMGIQLVGAPGTEQNLFVAAEILEQEFRGCVRAQPVSLKLPFNPSRTKKTHKV